MENPHGKSPWKLPWKTHAAVLPSPALARELVPGVKMFHALVVADVKTLSIMAETHGYTIYQLSIMGCLPSTAAFIANPTMEWF